MKHGADRCLATGDGSGFGDDSCNFYGVPFDMDESGDNRDYPVTSEELQRKYQEPGATYCDEDEA